MQGSGAYITTEEDAMKAEVGDRLVVHAHHLGESERDAEILQVIGEDGGPPFRVRWSDDGHEGLFFPGGDASVEHLEHRVVKRTRANDHSPGQPV
jgi:uncharacterized protein DUF1918